MFCIYNDIAIGKLRTEFYIYIYVYVYVYFLKSLTVLKNLCSTSEPEQICHHL